jgi:hypothetical protein
MCDWCEALCRQIRNDRRFTYKRTNSFDWLSISKLRVIDKTEVDFFAPSSFSHEALNTNDILDSPVPRILKP